MQWLFWFSVLVPTYVFIAYPLLVALLARVSPRPTTAVRPDGRLRSISIVIAAHDEQAHITDKLRTLIAQSYPRELVQIIVASDGSTDATAARALGMREHGVEVLDLPRGGKAAALNAAVALARGQILVFTDADNRWQTTTLERLVEPFADPGIGAVGGRIEIADRGRSLGFGDRVYRRFESWLRDNEHRAGCLVSIDGAILAIRRDLYETVPAHVTDDFFLSTAAPASGLRIGYAPGAVVEDHGLDAGRKQFNRRVRVTIRGLHSLSARRALMNPLRHGRYAVALVSHKLLRRLAPLFLPLLLASSLALWGVSTLYTAATAAQLCAYTAALLGLADSSRRLPRVFHLAGYGLVAVCGLVWGALRFACGSRLQRWTPADNR